MDNGRDYPDNVIEGQVVDQEYNGYDIDYVSFSSLDLVPRFVRNDWW